MKERIEAEIERLEREISVVQMLVRVAHTDPKVADIQKITLMKNQAFLKSLLEEDNG